MTQAEIAGRVDGGHLDCPHGSEPTGHGQADGVIQMPLAQQIVAVAVVGDQGAVLTVEIVDERQQVEEVLFGTALTNHDMHAFAQFFQGLFQMASLVVAARTGQDIGVQVKTGQPRRVPVNRKPLGCGELGHDLRVLEQHSGIIHHFRQTRNAIRKFFKHHLNVLRGNFGAGRFQMRGRNAGGHHAENLHGQLAGDVEQPFDSVQAQDIGQFVRIADRHGRAVGSRHTRETDRIEEGRLDMDVPLHQPRTHVAALGVQGLQRFVFTKTDDDPVLDAHALGMNLPGQDVDQPAVPDQQIHRDLSSGGS